MKRRVFAIVIAVLSMLATSSPQTPHAPASQFDAAGEAQMVQLINKARVEQGLPPLTVDDRLTQAARKHTELMVEETALSHQFEGEVPLQTRVSDQHVPSDHEGENVDLDRNIPSAHEALMLSPAHRHNILDPDFNAVGIAVIHSDDSVYVTEDFAHRLPELSEPQAEARVQAAIEQFQKSHGVPVPASKPLSELRHLACNMALNDALDSREAARLMGVHEVFAWTAGDPAKLPDGISQVLLPPPPGYSLGACFAPSVSHPGGLYWIVMVMY